MARAKRGRRKWSVERVVEELRRIQRAGKLRITATALINSGYTGLASAIHKYVGSFDRARRLAGIPHPGRLSSERKKWDEDVVIGELRRRHREREPLASKEVPSKLRDAAIFYCGSYQNAIEMAGLDYAKIRRSSPAWTRAALISALQRGAKSKKTGVGNDGPVPPSVWLAARREFGSIAAALAAAGLDRHAMLRTIKLDDRELGRRLRHLIKANRMMTAGTLRATPLGRVVVRRFGNLERGLERLGIRWKPRKGRKGPGRHASGGRLIEIARADLG